MTQIGKRCREVRKWYTQKKGQALKHLFTDLLLSPTELVFWNLRWNTSVGWLFISSCHPDNKGTWHHFDYIMFVRVGQSCLVFHHEFRAKLNPWQDVSLATKTSRKTDSSFPIALWRRESTLTNRTGTSKNSSQKVNTPQALKHRLADENVGVFPEPFHQRRDMVL